MLNKSSNVPAWEPFKLVYEEASISTGSYHAEAQITDDLLIMLIEEEIPNSQPVGAFQIKPRMMSLVLVDLQTKYCSRIKSDIAPGPDFRSTQGQFKLFREGNELLIAATVEGKILVWRLAFSQDYKRIVSLTKKSCEDPRIKAFSVIVLYKQNLCYFKFEQTEMPSLGGFTDHFRLPHEEFVTVDINTMEVKAHKLQGSKPTTREHFSSVLHKNQLLIYGGFTKSSFPKTANKMEACFADLWALDLDTLSWKDLSPVTSPIGRYFASICSVGERVYLFGGGILNPTGKARTESNLYAYDFTTNIWQNVETEQKALPDSDAERRRSYLSRHRETLIVRYSLNKCFSLPLGLSSNQQPNQTPKKIDHASLQAKDRILFTEKPFFDIVFKVQGKDIKAHKAILYAGSTFFRNMFTSGMEESNKNEIEIPNIRASVFEALLEYIYCGSVEISEDIAWEVLEEADKYSLPGLKVVCEDFLVNYITVENVVQTINMAEKYGANSLRGAALKYVGKNVDRVFEEADIHQLQKNTLLEIFKMKL